MMETAEQYIARILGNVGDRDAHAVLASTPQAVRRLVAGTPESKLTWSAKAGQWSVVQILAHLADAEIVSAWRLRSILAVDNVPSGVPAPYAVGDSFVRRPRNQGSIDANRRCRRDLRQRRRGAGRIKPKAGAHPPV